jgi:lysine 2,3-aminomutase
MDWRDLLKNSYRTAADLAGPLGLTAEEEQKMASIIERYPMCVNQYYFSLIDTSDRNGAIMRMAIPDLAESLEGGKADTSGEFDNTVVRGMQHKYRQTALILSTTQCAMYCRHCFRKRMVGMDGEEAAKYLPVMADYVRAHKEINNVLISGGDALLNSNEVLEKYLQYFTAISNLEFIRFGSRIPVVLPQRIYEDEALLELFRKYGAKKSLYIVTQFNHPREITPESIRAVQALQSAGCTVRNQTVLLRGVNDKPETLALLMNELAMYQVLPYYVFQCRPASGVKHQFQVPLPEASRIVEEAKRGMNGQAKSFHFVLSHPTGKIEILGAYGKEMLFKYHQAKHAEDDSRIFSLPVSDGQCWLEEIPPAQA